MLNDLQAIPDHVAEAGAIIARLDELFLAGFAGGRHQATLEALTRVFVGSPLEALIGESVASLGRGELHERSFLALAAARSALQGAQHDALWQQVRLALGRSAAIVVTEEVAPAQPEPLLGSVRHWLMELVVTGFRRLDAGAVLPFLTNLALLRGRPEHARLSFLLTGFADELLAAFPLAPPDDLPLRRWCDMWSAAMLQSAGSATAPEPRSITGTLYPLGLELRVREQLISVVVHGLLVNAETREYVRLTRSRFKVASIRGSEIWLLFPDFAPLLDVLEKGQSFDVRDMLRLPTGDLVWDAARAQPGAKCRLLDIAARALAPEAQEPATAMLFPPLDRHPIQLAKPVVLADYTLAGDTLQLAGGVSLPLDQRWEDGHGLEREAISNGKKLFGLLRFDNGRWALQPLSAASQSGKPAFVGQAGVKLLKKPPKSNPVGILEERASRLLRK